MAKMIVGERVGKKGKLAVGCSATVLDEFGRMLLVRRADNGRWAVPGGYMEPGESVAEACAREVKEECGLEVDVQELIAIYSSPNHLLVYEDGNKWQLVILHFYVEVIGGVMTAGDETTEVGFFAREDTAVLNLGQWDQQRVQDGFAFTGNTFIR